LTNESAEQFHSFFGANPKIADVMGSIGVTGAPVISIDESIDGPGTI
jgi:hypothetical protein